MKMVGDRVSKYWGWGFGRNHHISSASSFAIEAHGDQKRKYTGEPYWHHLREVAEIIGGSYNSLELEQVAWLHDVLEDTDATLEDIHWNFGARVACLVFNLTDKYTKEAYTDLNRAERKRRERERFRHAPIEAKIVKLADIISNTRSILKHDLAFSATYLEEKRLLLEESMQDVAHHRLYAVALKTVN